MGNDEVMISIPINTFLQLSDVAGRAAAFVDYVNMQKYAIAREECAAILGFELKAVEENV
ncbi:MAG: hypothetical protein IJZ23_12605 [Roseburia sp.]|nr:hypothetical protein [Roseburia sp.]